MKYLHFMGRGDIPVALITQKGRGDIPVACITQKGRGDIPVALITQKGRGDIPVALSILAWGFAAATAFAVIPANPASALKDVRKHYKEVKTLQASFKESFQWALTGETVDREGKVIVAEGNRFRVETPEQLIVSNGKEVYRFNKSRNQVMIESATKAEDLLPNKILLKFAAEFDATTLSPLAVEGVEGYRLDLKPEDPDKALLGEASIWVTAADKTVRRIRMVDLNNNATAYTLSDIRFDQPVDSSALLFTPPVGAELFDLR